MNPRTKTSTAPLSKLKSSQSLSIVVKVFYIPAYDNLNEMGGAGRAYGGEERRIQGNGGKT
jgi:hypothetical protein